MSIQLEDSASQETIWDFDVSMIPGILKTPELRPIRSMDSEESLGHISSQNTSARVVPREVSYSSSMNQRKTTRDITGVISWWWIAGPDVLHSKSSGSFAGGRDGATKSRPSSSSLETDGLPRWENCRGILWSYFLLAFSFDWLLLRDMVSCTWDMWVKSSIGLEGNGWGRLTI